MGKMKSLLLEKFGGSDLQKIIGKQVDVKLKEAAATADATHTGRREDIGWRNITGRDLKTFSPLEQKKMQKICYWLYDKNPLGHRIIERTKDFVIGDGMTFSCNDTAAMEVLQNHWDDPENAWEIEQADKIGELGLYGEQFYPAFVNTVSGHVKLGYVDPVLVTEVKTDPENAKKKIAYTKETTGDEPKEYKIIHIDENTESKTYGYLVGESFFFSINTVANMPRGRSDLLTIADAIDAYETFLFNQAERSDLLTRIIYDLEVQGKSDDEIKDILKKFKLPRSNEAFAHNEKTKLNIKTPDLSGADVTDSAKLVFNHIMGGSGFAPHWFGFAEGIVRATALAMDLPTKKQLKSRQKVFKWMVAYIFRYQIHQAIIHNKLSEDKKDVPFQIHLPKIEEKDTVAVATALTSVTNSLSIGVEEGWITSDEAQKIYIYVLNQLGLELKPEKKEQRQTEMDRKLKAYYMKKKMAQNGDIPEDDDGTNE